MRRRKSQENRPQADRAPPYERPGPVRTRLWKHDTHPPPPDGGWLGQATTTQSVRHRGYVPASSGYP
eukprot:4249624-Prymnesium_polylepis.1